MAKEHWRMLYCEDCGLKMTERTVGFFSWDDCDVCHQSIPRGAEKLFCAACGTNCCCKVPEDCTVDADGGCVLPAVFTLYGMVFRITNNEINGYPVWRSDGGGVGVVCYSDCGKKWTLAHADKETIMQSRGWAKTASAHGGAPPHSMRDWQWHNGKAWVPAPADAPEGRKGAYPTEWPTAPPARVRVDRVCWRVPDRMINGCALWCTKGDGDPTWMYSGASDGKWSIIGDDVAKLHFKPDTASILSALPHFGRRQLGGGAAGRPAGRRLDLEWQCWDDKDKVWWPLTIQPRHGAPPAELVLELDPPMQKLSGIYKRATNWKGCPAWERQGGNGFVYSGNAGAWYISDTKHDWQGQVSSRAPHGGRMPHEVTEWAHSGGQERKWFLMERAAVVNITAPGHAAGHVDPERQPSESPGSPAASEPASPASPTAATASPTSPSRSMQSSPGQRPRQGGPSSISERQQHAQQDPPSRPVSAKSFRKRILGLTDWTFQTSLYKQIYVETEVPSNIVLVQDAIRDTFRILAKDPKSSTDKEFNEMRSALEEVISVRTVAEVQSSPRSEPKQTVLDGLKPQSRAVLLWTAGALNDSKGKSRNATVDGRQMEFCGIVNYCIRSNRRDLLVAIMPFIRALTAFCNADREVRDDCVRGPWWDKVMGDPGDRHCKDLFLYRGGSFKSEFRSWFKPKTMYRSPGFLATTPTLEVANNFIERTVDKKTRRCPKGFEPVLWRFRVDGFDLCKHVCYLNRSLVYGKKAEPLEDEFLFSPFSTFTVLSVDWKDGNDWRNPSVINVKVHPDNKPHHEDLPNAPWG